MTSVNDLPVEVLANIFILASTENLSACSWHSDGKQYLRLFSRKPDRNRPPFVFLQVCGHWRSVAEATSLLWTSLDATLRMAATRISTSIAAMEHWMSLSRSAPLDFLLETNIEDDENGSYALSELKSAHAAAVLQVLANEAHRWRSASFLIDHHVEGFVDILLTRFNDASLQNLKRLEIFFYTDNGVLDPVTNLTRAIGNIKSLTELYLTLTYSYAPLLLADISWSQLTTVYFNMMLSPGRVASFLAQLTAVVTATFTYITKDDGLSWDVQDCIIPNLKNLTMVGFGNMLCLFDRIAFPRLEQLDLSSTSFSCYQVIQHLMKQPNLSIHRLALRVSDGVSESDFANCLRIQRLRQVSHVEFTSWNVLRIAPHAIAQLKDDIPVLWSWKSLKQRECVGWKTRFDDTDGEIKRISPAP